jgi:simple sugar transport system permease protein
MIVMVVGVGVSWFLLQRTGWGLGVRAAGEYPPAVEATGFSVRKLRIQALMFGAVFGGLGGAYLSLVITGSFAENMTAGRGFVAIAMVTFGRWKPLYAFVASLLIGFAGSLQFWLQGKGWAIPYQFFVALPYVVGKEARAPASLARPYLKDSP